MMDDIVLNGPLVTRGGKSVALSRSESALLGLLLGPENRGGVYHSLDECAFAVYGDEDKPVTYKVCLRVFKSSLARKLERVGIFIRTTYGKGYMVELV